MLLCVAVRVCCAVQLIPVELCHAFKRKMLNIHPGLLPSFGGKGYYGERVHQAVLASGARCACTHIWFAGSCTANAICLQLQHCQFGHCQLHTQLLIAVHVGVLGLVLLSAGLACAKATQQCCPAPPGEADKAVAVCCVVAAGTLAPLSILLMLNTTPGPSWRSE